MLRQVIAFWGMAKITLRPLSLHVSKRAFLVKWFCRCSRDANNHSNKAHGKDLLFAFIVQSVLRKY